MLYMSNPTAPGQGMISGSKGPKKNTMRGVKGSRKYRKERHTSGSKGPTKKGKAKTAATIKYLSVCRYLLTFSGRFLCRILVALRTKVIKSMYKPNGQIQPQKKRPKTTVATTIAPKVMDGQRAKMFKVKKIVIKDET